MSQEAIPQQISDKPEMYFEHPRTEMLDFLPAKAKTFLDVGCGAGTFGKQVKDKYDCEYWGIELDPEAAEIARTRLDNVKVGGAPDSLYDLPDGHFDCIIFNDVLEHLVDPYEVLRFIKSKLSPVGVITASIPNVRHFETMWKLVVKKQWRYEDAGILDRTHLRFFTHSSILEMFDEQDYDIEVIEGINKSTSRFERLCNLMTLGWLSDTLYLQYAVRARPRR
ncbi:Class I SAM-dependent methyltransferase [Sulfidibacter corallicola]|uniref:Class I SAM-dependent methyltransferase n=1 Tax=Sulfidibacter corallicola TaxID=2818388 RepID=A0A8A4TID9_SULCO|nr:class I SAM-dependent methyltransferase [Sulfidibacter corallicola]QTD48548.1 class I SAM-dependent methyltransferase [Sulfidibacter corallicola]